MNKLGQKIQPLKKIRLRKKAQEKEDEIKRKLHKSNQDWNVWKFQIHWNKLEWVNTRSGNEHKKSLFVYFNSFV